MNSEPRLTRNAVVLSKLDTLGSVFPESRVHRRILNDCGSDFTYAAEAPRDSPFSGLWLALVRLSPDLEEQLAIHQEIPVIYSPHADIQGRTIVRLSEILDYLPRERQGFAGGIVFFWAPDVKLEAKLEQFSRTELVLLPLPVSSADRFLLMVRARLYSQDLYRERTAVTGDQFFGRRSILMQLRGDLENHRVAAVFGTRKTGKTSILKELVRTSAVDGRAGLKEVFVYEDLEHLPRASSGRDVIPELLGDLTENIRRELKMRGLRTKELGDLPAEPTLVQFRRALTAILGHPSNCELYLVIILDEVEHLCPPDASRVESNEGNESIPQFLGVLRKLVQELDNFNFMVAGLASAIVESGELYERHNPLFNLANTYYLSPFTRPEAKELLQGIGSRLGMRWGDDAIDTAQDESGGQVVLLRELAAQVWEMKRTNTIETVSIASEDVDSVIGGYRRAVRSQINETINHVKRYYPDEYELCAELLAHPAGFSELANAYPAEVHRLINLGLVVEESGKWSPTRVLSLGWPESGTAVAAAAPSDAGTALELIQTGEGRHLEFKSSVRTPMNREVAEIIVVEAFVKAVLGFLNSDGGRLLAGVSDDGIVLGLAQDIKQTGRSKDKLLRFVVDKLNTYIGQSTTSVICVQWEEVEGKDILIVDVPRSDVPVFPVKKVDGKEDLFVRQNANVVPLAGAELYSYTSRRF